MSEELLKFWRMRCVLLKAMKRGREFAIRFI